MTTLRVLLGVQPGRAVQEDDLADLYAYPDPLPRTPAGHGWLRACMLATVDGASSGGDGLSGSISSPADRAVLATLRGLADVVLVGAGTARAEGYRRPLPNPKFAAGRKARGQDPAPALAVVTASGKVPDLLMDRSRDVVGRLIVLTAAAAGPDCLARLRERLGENNVVLCGQDRVDPAESMKALATVGLSRVVCEGGPTWLADLTAAGLLDELCLTTSPVLAGGTAGRVLKGAAAGSAGLRARLELCQLLQAGDGFQFARWVATPAD